MTPLPERKQSVMPQHHWASSLYPQRNARLRGETHLAMVMEVTEGKGNSTRGTVGEISRQFGMKSESVVERRLQCQAVERMSPEVGHSGFR